MKNIFSSWRKCILKIFDRKFFDRKIFEKYFFVKLIEKNVDQKNQKILIENFLINFFDRQIFRSILRKNIFEIFRSKKEQWAQALGLNGTVYY